MIDFDIIIPARLKSTRFPNKVLYEFFGLPMIEHVRRRALLIKGASKVIVATCDVEIFDLVKSYGGDAIMTSDKCKNGTERVAEASKSLKSKYIILLQGDEPCFYPVYVEGLINFVKKTKGIVYNLVAPIDKQDILTDISSVKCSVDHQGDITNCFRTTPYISNFDFQRTFIKKLLGIICYERLLLTNLDELKLSKLSIKESIEQLKLLENKIVVKAFQVSKDVPSFNVEPDIKKLEKEFKMSEQKEMLSIIL